MLINYEQSRNFRTVLQTSFKKSSAGVDFALSLPAKRLLVKTGKEKIYLLTHESLLSAGVPLSEIDPREMRLYHKDTELPMYIQG